MFTLKDRNISKHTAKLSNGARIVLFEQSNMPISIQTLIIGGSRFDKHGKEGTAHFLEHMLCVGTRKFPSRGILSAFIEDLGGYSNASTNSDRLRLIVTVAQPEDVSSAIQLLLEQLMHSLFLDKNIETERGSIQRELAQKMSNPTGALHEITNQLLFQGTDAGRPTLGTKDTIDGISKNDLLEFMEKYVNTNNLLFLVSGGVDIDKLQDLIEKEMILPEGKSYIPKIDLPVTRETHLAFQNFKGDNLNIALAFRTASYLNSDHRAISVLASILGGAGSSSLRRLLRYEKGLVYSVAAATSFGVDNGELIVHTSISRKNLDEVLDVITSELIRMKTSGPNEEELVLVKHRLIKSTIRTMQTADDWAAFHMKRELFDENNMWSVEDYFKEVEEVTREDIKRVATKYINDKWYLSATGDIDEDSLNKITIEL